MGFGVPLISGNMFGNMDSAMYERVDGLRGANGLTSGTGNPSATINLVRKRPTVEWQGTIQASAGSWDNQRHMADIGDALVEDASIRGRTVIVTKTADSYLDRYEKDNSLFYGVIEADLSELTLLTAGYSYEVIIIVL
ncbi:MAG: outer membrane receptor for ferric coprogen and ferric-rhodotorulic acid [Lentimonas sp.]|jgi:outer membrane receptor for ferric coprogen and ferric-rhodotorulic acid